MTAAIALAGGFLDEVHTHIDFVNDTYRYIDQEFDDFNFEGLYVSGPGGIALTPGGSLKYVAPNLPRRFDGLGLLYEPASSSILNNMFNAAPTTTAGWVLLSSRPAGATLTLVDDSAEMYAAQDPVSGEYIFRDLMDAGIISGMVVEAYNPDATVNFAVPTLNVTAGTYSFSAYVRSLEGTGFLSVTAGGGSTPDFVGTQWARVGRTHVVATSGQVRLTVKPLSRVRIILACLEPGNLITSPIITKGTIGIRKRDICRMQGTDLFRGPHTIVAEVYMGLQNNVRKHIMSVANAYNEEISIVRHSDNSLSSEQTNKRWRPRLPRIFGPGILRVAHRTSAIGRTVGCNSALQHDEFSTPPTGMYRLLLGSDAADANHLNGWIRSIEITGEVDDETLRDMIEPPVGSMTFDMFRYVDQVAGNDANTGASEAQAWKTLNRAADVLTVPVGTHILLKRGQTWNETLKGLNYATFRPYGTGARPHVGLGQTWGCDENGQGAFRVEDILISGATSRGFNSYGGSGIWLENCEISYCGEEDDDAAIGVSCRGNTRAPGVVPGIGAVTPLGATLSNDAATEFAAAGVWTITCTVGGTGTTAKWAIRRPNNSLHGTANGDSGYNNVVRFRLTDTGTPSTVGEQFTLTVTNILDMPLPTNALTSDFGMRLCYMHNIAGAAAGDDVYCEGVQGLIRLEGCTHEIPIGRAADCFQASRTTYAYVADPAHVICRCNYMSMQGASTTSGKGGIVIIAGSSLTEDNYVYGLNFCISLSSSHIIARRNFVEHARYQPYSWGIGVGGSTDEQDITIYRNIIKDCNRAISMSGTGSVVLYTLEARLQYRRDIIASKNVFENNGAAFFFDRPTSGMFFDNTLRGDGILLDFRASASPAPTGGRYTDFKFGPNHIITQDTLDLIAANP